MFEPLGPLPQKPMQVVVSIEVPNKWEEGYSLSELAGILTSIGQHMLYGHQLSGEVVVNSQAFFFDVEDEL